MGNGDSDFYQRRIAQESEAARNATCADARDVHHALAERYAAKLRLIEVLSTDLPKPVRDVREAPPPPSFTELKQAQPRRLNQV